MFHRYLIYETTAPATYFSLLCGNIQSETVNPLHNRTTGCTTAKPPSGKPFGTLCQTMQMCGTGTDSAAAYFLPNRISSGGYWNRSSQYWFCWKNRRNLSQRMYMESPVQFHRGLHLFRPQGTLPVSLLYWLPKNRLQELWGFPFLPGKTAIIPIPNNTINAIKSTIFLLLPVSGSALSSSFSCTVPLLVCTVSLPPCTASPPVMNMLFLLNKFFFRFICQLQNLLRTAAEQKPFICQSYFSCTSVK